MLKVRTSRVCKIVFTLYMIKPYQRAIRLGGGRRLAARDLAVVRHDLGRKDNDALDRGVAHAERLGQELAHLAGGRLSIREAGVVALGTFGGNV